ncbi:helix-turn-helix transcriptional regulator [Clostridium paraputrificum]|uniref:helix-turn-helix domain-containing protein n=1 Tax=Clostridium paraputrificum TaxID=29363 RepID=UPI00232D1C6A|nr:helix-turn-helix transcriptional regulator [Clostridium paraputrificum]MDB2076538.1 helix-turn-helix transcriptional regulator [Clostridium paraputrificum]MDB2080081.1 helix-turn-helix transcriptional regulator [Clostridium paraputrificum]
MSINVGLAIKEARKKNKITQKQLADLISKSERMIQKYENNEVTPSLDVVKDISKKLNTNIYTLLVNDAINIINETINENEKEIDKIQNMLVLDAQCSKNTLLNENLIKKWFLDDIKALIDETLTSNNVLRYNRNDFTDNEIEEIGYFVYLSFNTKINEILSRKNTSKNEYDKDIFKY